MMRDMNTTDKDQKEEIYNSLYARFNRESFWKATKKVQGQVGYHKGNEIASYSLYNSEYYMSKNVEELLISRGIDITKEVNRSAIFNIRVNGNGTKHGKKLTTFEHPIPTRVQFDLVNEIYKQKGEITHNELTQILDSCGVVVILTQEENKLLQKAKLVKSLPNGANPMVDTFSRYTAVGIELSDKKVKVCGGMYR